MRIKTLCFSALIIMFTYSTMATAGSMFSEDDPALFDLNTTLSGGYSDEHPMYNYFIISLEQDGDFIITHSAAGGYVFIQLSSADPAANGTNILPYQYGGEDENERRYSLKAGSYGIRVENHLIDTMSYTLTNSFGAASLPDNPEPNDTLAEAAALPTGVVTGHLGYVYDAWGGMPVYNSFDSVDWWKITVEQDGYIVVEATMESTLEFTLYLYDGDQEIVATYYDSDNRDNVEFQVSAGTYYIKTDFGNGFGSYTLDTSFSPALFVGEGEDNDSKETASTLTGSATGTIGFCTGGGSSYKTFDTADWWLLELDTEGLLTITTASENEFEEGPLLKLGVYHSENGLFFSNYNSEKALETESSLPLRAGVYYIKTETISGYGSYTVTAELIPAALANDPESNDNRDTASELMPDTPVTGHLGFANDDYYGLNYETYDFWKIVLDSDESIDITLNSEGDFADPLVMNLYLFSETGSILATDYNSGGLSELTMSYDCAAGTYYIRPGRKSGYGSYTLLAAIHSEPLVFVTEILPAAESGSEYSVVVEVGNAGDETLSFSITDGPDWLTIDNSGFLSGTPGNNDTGSGIPVRIFASTGTRSATLETSIDVGSSVDVDSTENPREFLVRPPYPNPFNAVTTLHFEVPVESDVSLAVYDILGRKVAILSEGSASPGVYEIVWDGRDMNGMKLGTGTYLYRFSAKGFVRTGKLMLLQ